MGNNGLVNVIAILYAALFAFYGPSLRTGYVVQGTSTLRDLPESGDQTMTINVHIIELIRLARFLRLMWVLTVSKVGDHTTEAAFSYLD